MVVSELNNVRGKWENLGKQLGLEYWLNDIRINYSDPADCLKGLIRQWLPNPTKLLTWSHLVHALKSPIIGESELGDRLKEKYFPGEL